MNGSTSIYNILTRKKFSRETAFYKTKVLKIIEQALSKNKAIPLVGFWGCGPKSEADRTDIASCKFLEILNKEIRKIHPPGIKFTFIFADLHGIQNNYDSKNIKKYKKSIKKLFKTFKFKFIPLKKLWRKYKISPKYIEKTYLSKSKNWWNKLKNTDIFEKNAKSISKNSSPQVSAQKYYIMRDLEKNMLETEFSNQIFHTFSSTLLKGVLPKMPTLYLRSRKGRCDSPWFITK